MPTISQTTWYESSVQEQDDVGMKAYTEFAVMDDGVAIAAQDLDPSEDVGMGDEYVFFPLSKEAAIVLRDFLNYVYPP